MTDYRAFGEAQAAVLTTDQTFDLSLPKATKNINGNLPACDYRFAHLLVLSDCNISITLAFPALPANAGPFTMDVKAGQQIAAVSKLYVNSGGYIQAIFLL